MLTTPFPKVTRKSVGDSKIHTLVAKVDLARKPNFPRDESGVVSNHHLDATSGTQPSPRFTKARIRQLLGMLANASNLICAHGAILRFRLRLP